MTALQAATADLAASSATTIAPERQGAIVIMDQSPLFRAAVGRVISSHIADFPIVEVNGFDALRKHLKQASGTAYVLYDLTTDRGCNFAGLLYLRAAYPEIPVLVMSATADAEVMRHCLATGAAGFVPKALAAHEFADAFESFVRTGTWRPDNLVPREGDASEKDELIARLALLTSQEIRVLILLCDGLFNRDIADRLAIAEATVKAHVSKILGKLGVFSRTQAVIAVTRMESECIGVRATG